MTNCTRWYGTWLGVITVVFTVDRVTKWWAANTVDSVIVIIRRWLEIEYVNNTAVLFSFVPSSTTSVAVLATVLLLILYIASREYLEGHHRHVIALLFICAGALSNIIDRVTTGGVIDFISLPWWSVFNIADVMIVGGVASLLWWSTQRSKTKSTPPLAADDKIR